MKIFIVRKTYNEYDQPENNLCAIWTTKPNVYMIIEAMGLGRDLVSLKEDALIAVVSVLRGDSVRFQDCDYKLQEIEEGAI